MVAIFGSQPEADDNTSADRNNTRRVALEARSYGNGVLMFDVLPSEYVVCQSIKESGSINFS